MRLISIKIFNRCPPLIKTNSHIAIFCFLMHRLLLQILYASFVSLRFASQREQLPFAAGSFDKVLVDAPCSGTGTLRRNPEIRWRLTPLDFGKFAEQQKLILIRAAEMVKPGGRLIYSTCSVEPQENEEVIEEVMARDERFQLVKTRRTWPQREGCDGFFVAVCSRLS